MSDTAPDTTTDVPGAEPTTAPADPGDSPRPVDAEPIFTGPVDDPDNPDRPTTPAPAATPDDPGDSPRPVDGAPVVDAHDPAEVTAQNLATINAGPTDPNAGPAPTMATVPVEAPVQVLDQPDESWYEIIAACTHDANRQWCRYHLDDSQVPWDQAAQWQRDSAIAGVRAIHRGEVTSPSESHESWLATKEADGWEWGPVKDVDAKKHPAFLPHAELDDVTRAKDEQFFAIAKALIPFYDPAV